MSEVIFELKLFNIIINTAVIIADNNEQVYKLFVIIINFNR